MAIRKPKVQKPKPKNKIIQYYFRADRVAQKKKEGWREIGAYDTRKHPGIKDLILMEKQI